MNTPAQSNGATTAPATGTPPVESKVLPEFDIEKWKDGKYYWMGRAKSWAHGKASTGKQQLVVTFEATTTQGERFEGERAFYFTTATAARTLESLQAMGFDPGEPADVMERIAEVFNGGGGLDKNPVKLTVEIGEREIEDENAEGGVRKFRGAEIMWVNKPSRFVLTPATDSDIAEVGQALQAAMLTRKAATTSASNRAPTMNGNAAPNIPKPKKDDDLPF